MTVVPGWSAARAVRPPVHAGRAWLTAIAASAACLAGATAGEATCPPFESEKTSLGFFVAVSRGTISAADRDLILKGGVIPGVPIGLWPPRGPAPLQVGVTWLAPPENPQAILLDADGDGTPEAVDTSDANLGHRYTRPGEYAATVSVRDQAGTLTTYPSAVTVLTPAAFEAEILARWSTFKAALKRRDVPAALECVLSLRRDKLQPHLRNVRPDDVDRRLPALRLAETRVAHAVFTPGRPMPGVAGLVRVVFVVDMDGVWRLASFDPEDQP